MTDRIDYANTQSEQILAMQIKNAAAHTAPSPITDCVDCGVRADKAKHCFARSQDKGCARSVGEERKKVAPYAVRCITCQTFFEKTGGIR